MVKQCVKTEVTTDQNVWMWVAVTGITGNSALENVSLMWEVENASKVSITQNLNVLTRHHLDGITNTKFNKVSWWLRLPYTLQSDPIFILFIFCLYLSTNNFTSDSVAIGSGYWIQLSNTMISDTLQSDVILEKRTPFFDHDKNLTQCYHSSLQMWLKFALNLS